MVTRVDKFLGGLGIDATDKFEVSSNATVTVGNGTSTGNVHVGGRVAIGNSPAEADLYVRGDSVGTSAGDQSLVGVFRADATNQNRIEISATREDAGSTWNDAGMRIQQKVDTTYQSYIQFNGINNDHGISFGTGASATATGVAERMRIVTGTGNVGIGTTTPSERLEVNGTVKATEFNGLGAITSVVTSNTTSGSGDFTGCGITASIAGGVLTITLTNIYTTPPPPPGP